MWGTDIVHTLTINLLTFLISIKLSNHIQNSRQKRVPATKRLNVEESWQMQKNKEQRSTPSDTPRRGADRDSDLCVHFPSDHHFRYHVHCYACVSFPLA